MYCMTLFEDTTSNNGKHLIERHRKWDSVRLKVSLICLAPSFLFANHRSLACHQGLALKWSLAQSKTLALKWSLWGSSSLQLKWTSQTCWGSSWILSTVQALLTCLAFVWRLVWRLVRSHSWSASFQVVGQFLHLLTAVVHEEFRLPEAVDNLAVLLFIELH